MAKRKRNWPSPWIVALLLVALAAVVTAREVKWHPFPRPPHSVRVAVTEPRQPEEKPAPPTAPYSRPVPPPEQPLAAILSPSLTKPKPLPQSLPTRPRIAIVIDDMGLNLSSSARAVALPAAVTLSYIPYAKNLPAQAARAKAAGHELLLHLPMEPLGDADPGPGALLTALPPDALRERTEKALDSFSGYNGVNNHMGSKFSTDAAGLDIVMTALKQRDLFFLDSRTTGKSIAAQSAAAHGQRHATRDEFLDDDMAAPAVASQLAQTERLARRKGFAIAIGHPHPATLAALEAWLPHAERAGYEIVPLSKLLRRAGE